MILSLDTGKSVLLGFLSSLVLFLHSECFLNFSKHLVGTLILEGFYQSIYSSIIV